VKVIDYDCDTVQYKVILSNTQWLCLWYWVIPSDNQWYPEIPSDIQWYPVIPSGTDWYQVIPSDTECYRVKVIDYGCDTVQYKVILCNTQWLCLWYRVILSDRPTEW